MEIEDGLVRYQLQQTAEEHRDTLSELWAAHPFDLGPSCSDIALQSKVDASGSDLKPPNRCLNGHLSQAQGCRGLKSLLDDALLAPFYSSRVKGSPKGPELQVDGVGRIILPLTAAAREKLQGQCQLQNTSSLHEVWSLQPSLLAGTNPVHPLSQSETQAWLQKAMIVDCGIEYCSEIGTQPEHVAYGTMILVRMPPGQEVHVSVRDEAGETDVTLTLPRSDQPHLECLAFTAGYTYKLQITRKTCCEAFVYNLAQLSGELSVAKDRSYFRKHLKDMLGDADWLPRRCWCYLLNEEWTLSDLQKMHKLDFQHQALALTLHDAQQQGILQAFLVMIRDKPDCTKLQQAAGECPGYNPAMTRITDWRDLSGQDPGFYSMTMDCNEKDIILQGQGSLCVCTDCSHRRQQTAADSGACSQQSADIKNKSNRWRLWTPRAALVFWPYKQRWITFCLQGVNAAFDELHKLVKSFQASHAAAQTSSATATEAGCNNSSPDDVQPTSCQLKQDISMLISTLWDMFPDKVPWYWTRTLDITGFASLTELAVAFDAAWVPCETWVPCEMIEMIHQKLKKGGLTRRTTLLVVQAAKLLPWNQLLPLIKGAVAQQVRPNIHMDTTRIIQICSALALLVETQGERMVALAAEAAVLVAAIVRQSISHSDPYDLGDVVLNSSWCTKPHCHLKSDVLTAVNKLFQALLRTKCNVTHQQLFAELDEAHCDLVDACLAHPELFPVGGVLGPICSEMLADATSRQVTELPATIKLITGIIARVQANCETSDSQVAGLPHCCCELCKTLLLFLQAPAQHAMDTEVSGPEFPHMCRQLQMTVGRVKQQYDATYVPSAARSVHRVHKKGHVPKYALLQQVIVNLCEDCGQPPSHDS